MPAIRVGGVIDGFGDGGVVERMEGVDHDGEFFSLLDAEAFFDGSRMGAVRDATGVQGDGGAFDAAPAAEVAVDIIEHFVAVNVAVVVGHRDRERMVVQFARDKGADDKVGSLEGLVDRRRLVDTTSDGLEVADIEDPGIFTAVPANHIERMEVVPVAGDQVSNLQAHLEFP